MAEVQGNTRDGSRIGFGLGAVIIASTALVAVILGGLYTLGAEAWIKALFAWIDDLGWLGLVAFGLIDAIAMVLLLPASVFTIGAGFLFGTVRGVLVILLATTIGAVIAFLLGRTFSNRLRTHLQRYPKVCAVIDSAAAGGWRTVLLTRLVPFFPFKLSNYVFGLTTLRLRDFTMGTFIGIMPWTVTNVLVGALAGDITTALSTNRSRPPWEWGLYGVGLIALIVLLHTVGKRAAAALEEHGGGCAEVSDPPRRTV
jgi:uncharacterized membrane protein YdjX (TVP38/TMEM64 family)